MEWGAQRPDATNCLTPKAFADLLIGYGSRQMTERAQSGIERLSLSQDSTAGGDRLSFDDLLGVQMVVDNIDEVRFLLSLFVAPSASSISSTNFSRAVVAVTGYQLNPRQIAVLEACFGVEGKPGYLDHDSLVASLKARSHRGHGGDRGFGLSKFFGCLGTCVAQATSSG